MGQRYENNVFKSHISNIEAAPGITQTVHLPPPLQTDPTIRGKQNGKSKGSRNAKSAAHRPYAGISLLDYDSVKLFVHLFLFAWIYAGWIFPIRFH